MAKKRASSSAKAARALFAKRSAAAKKGWATRRRNNAGELLRGFLKKPGGPNLRKGKPTAYRVRKYGITFRGRRFDFRGLNAKQQRAMLQVALNASDGQYVRMLVASTDEGLARGLYVGQLENYLRRHRKGRPYWFWTMPYGPVTSTLDAYDHIQSLLAGTDRHVKIVLIEVL